MNDVTPALDEFLREYKQDDNVWWVLSCGHHMNLFDEAVERLEEIGGDGDAASLGLVKLVFEKGQQVLGTCSPADTISYSALLSRLQRIQDESVTSVEKYRVELCMNEVRALLGGGS